MKLTSCGQEVSFTWQSRSYNARQQGRVCACACDRLPIYDLPHTTVVEGLSAEEGRVHIEY
jgi:hypothetical protein